MNISTVILKWQARYPQKGRISCKNTSNSPASAPVQLNAFPAPGRIPYAEAMRGDFAPIQVGHKFGPLWSTHWVRLNLEIPADWHGQEVHLRWDSASEACVFVDGMPLQGLTGAFNGWRG